MPDWTVKFQFVSTIIYLLISFLPKILSSILMIGLGIAGIICLYHYLKRVEMSGGWALIPILAILLVIWGTSMSKEISPIGPSITTGTEMFGSLIVLLGLGLIIACLVAYSIANIRVGKGFGKKVPFLVGLVILPWIFMPILGYQDEY